MIRYKITMLLIITFLAAMAAYGQAPRVHSGYKKQLKATVVHTDKMHLFNTPEQVINVEFNFHLKQKQSRKQPESVELTLWSYPRELEYRKDEGKDISLVADGNMLKVEKVKSMPFQKRKAEFERFKGTYSEWIILSFSPQEARKLALAKSLKLRSGNQEFEFKDLYVNTIRDFASRIPRQ